MSIKEIAEDLDLPETFVVEIIEKNTQK